MAARSIASLTLSFGLVSIPVKLYSATESSSAVRFNLLAQDGSRLKQQYVSEKSGQVVPRAEMVKGYEFEPDRYVTFTSEELKALEDASSHSIDIVAFIPADQVDPLYYDKAYFLAPDKRGAKPYNLLREAMRRTDRHALAKWAWKGKQYVVQLRPTEQGVVLQQLLYADEVRRMADLDIEQTTVSDAELKLATQLIDQIAQDTYDPAQYEDEEKKRILAAIDQKISGQQVVTSAPAEAGTGAQVIDLMDALRASLGRGKGAGPAKSAAPAEEATADKPRRPARRSAAAPEAVAAAPAPSRKRATR
ncbi:Ku protein [Aquabacterium sp. J223]|uniref:non-homologous end joining protein Ku n=1 Tax=Aquabacterium sp. J223 TaxID=2898431 RepID=UPI0021ADE35B|nr:Ku protein [Aquabacterium sp. J223]UUX97922.1 Ku protein [Aquabacterium sp. J223]